MEGEDGQREIRGRATFGYAYEGPPTCVHGGIIAALFDEVMGAANIIAENPGLTGTLTVRYRRPTPLLAPLDIVARYAGSERRKVFTWGGIYHDGVLTAEAEGIFITMDPNRLLDIAATNALASDEQVLDHDFAAHREESRRLTGVGFQQPTLSSMSSRMRSACPLCRAYSSIMWT